jgi:hypothetical protein
MKFICWYLNLPTWLQVSVAVGLLAATVAAIMAGAVWFTARDLNDE